MLFYKSYVHSNENRPPRKKLTSIKHIKHEYKIYCRQRWINLNPIKSHCNNPVTCSLPFAPPILYILQITFSIEKLLMYLGKNYKRAEESKIRTSARIRAPGLVKLSWTFVVLCIDGTLQSSVASKKTTVNLKSKSNEKGTTVVHTL